MAAEVSDGESRMSRRRLLAAGATVGAGAIIGTGSMMRRASAAVVCEERYQGYREADLALPYASYFTPTVDDPQANVPAAIAAGPLPTSRVPSRKQTFAALASPGYTDVETGYGRTANGEVFVACLTRMPGVEPRMWDWWFGWHSDKSAKYKLWHPEDHRYVGIRRDLVDAPGLTDRQRYVGNVSYPDEVIGGDLNQLAISFVEPASFGIDTSAFDGTAICARVGTPLAPVDIGLLVHQVRRVRGGTEMRSRFYLNVPHLGSFDAKAFRCAVERGLVPPSAVVFPVEFGADLLRHNGEEMNHLAARLPDLHADFGRGRPRTA